MMKIINRIRWNFQGPTASKFPQTFFSFLLHYISMNSKKELILDENCIFLYCLNLCLYLRPIAIPTMLSFTIVNDGSEPLEMYSLSGTNMEFYSSFTQQTILSAAGGNVSINIYYLPRTIGQQNKTLTIETSRGHFSYQVNFWIIS